MLPIIKAKVIIGASLNSCLRAIPGLDYGLYLSVSLHEI